MLRPALALLLLVAPAAFANGSVVVSDGWVRAAPPTARVLAAYLTIRNPGGEAVVLDGATSPDFARVELHEMRMDDGVMRMRKLERLDIAAGGELVLEPGATHLMLFEPRRALARGDTVSLSLHFESRDAAPAVELTVADAAPESAP
jgi:hypothetical protein